MVRGLFLLMILALGSSVIGCSSPVNEEQIPVQASNDPLHEPRQILGRYAAGQPMSSEVTMFPSMIENVRKSDPKSADTLEAGLDEIQKASPQERAAKANELLQKIQPMAYPAAPAP